MRLVLKTADRRQMADRLSTEKRSWLMSRVRASNTQPEKLVEIFLRRSAVRFRRHDRTLPGTPDIVIPGSHVIIFVNGCFWHGHSRCRRSKLPSTRRKFWAEKIRANQKRDRWVRRVLRRAGWVVLTLWGCRVSNSSHLSKVLGRFLNLNETRMSN